ncbi:MAG TPA: hypothetical protein VHA12_00755 [Candidatus Nanoarchaeia archaeon]|nr:hypothetical protein [Candidatus Nanoarchaeia archaeon]
MREVHKGIFPEVPLSDGNFHSRALTVLETNPSLFGERKDTCITINREPERKDRSLTYQESVDLIFIYDRLKRRSQRYGVAIELKTIERGELSLRDRAKAESQLFNGIRYISSRYDSVAHTPYGILVTVSREGVYEWERIYADELRWRWEFNQEIKRKR